uniref:PPM-type phosphatase domain-containing protein n=1 Tax=Eiseniibacteriota bacterium TaxID=2212470 RepID=A0A832I126_UNCEI
MATPSRRGARRLAPAWRIMRRLLLLPVLALPFALFFGTLFGRGMASYWLAYQIALVFAAAITVAIAVADRLRARAARSGPARSTPEAIARGGLLYTGAAILGSFAAGAIVHFTILPGFLGGPRQVLVMGMFTLLFSVLALAISYALSFYRNAIEKAKAEEELELARRIQRSFLRTSFPELPDVEIHATNLSSRHVSGDFYDVVPDGDGRWLLAIADVSGKGVPAALLTSMLQASLRTQAGRGEPVPEILSAINRLVCQNESSGQFATFFLARLEQHPLRLTFSNAGHNYPVVFRDGGERRFLVRGGVVVGFLEDAAFEEEALPLAPGDRLVFYTDGVTEAANRAGEMYGEERLYALIHGLPPHLPARETADRILADVRAFLDGAEAGDDITLLVARVRPTAGVAGAVAGA